MKIDRLIIKNFKGLASFDVRLGGRNATIRGQNGTGKTTVVDALTWALACKMNGGRTSSIDRYDETGRRGAAKNCSVEVAFTDGTTFRRESNGSAKFCVNGVPVTAKEYAAEIANFTNGAAELLITPQSFCRLKWQDMRALLLKIVGDISNDEIIARFEELAPLADFLKKDTPDQILRRAKDARKGLDAELKAIPARIDELQRKNPAPDITAAELQSKIAELQTVADEKSAELAAMQDSIQKIASLNAQINTLERAKLDAESRRAKTENQLERTTIRLNALRNEYAALAKATTGTCPTCGAIIQNKKISEIRQQLADITSKGTAHAASQKNLQTAIATLNDEIATIASQITSLKNTAAASDFKNIDANHRALIAQRDALFEKIARAKSMLAAIDNNDTAARIAELRNTEKAVSAKISSLDQEIYLAETFVKRKTELLEDAINANFQFVRFRLSEDFKTTDGQRTTFEPMIGGVGYQQLSKGERLKADLDILRALQKFYGVELPVFIDDAESITSNSLVSLPNQTIRLMVAEGVAALQVDVDSAEG